MKAILISIRPEWCERIISGEKTVEIRKNRPKLEPPFKCYVYRTNGYVEEYRDEKGVHYQWCQGGVIGEFLCDEIAVDRSYGHNPLLARVACLSPADAASYCVNSKMYGWHISDFKVYTKPKTLCEFMKPCPNEWDCECCAMFREFNDECGNMALRIKRAPQSWCYVEELT